MASEDLLTLPILALVALGSALGAMARLAVSRRLQPAPAGQTVALDTLLVNLSGAFAVGFLLPFEPSLGGASLALLVVGFLGSYTTVSALSLHSLVLARSRSWRRAAMNLAANLFGGLGLATLGFALSRMLLA